MRRLTTIIFIFISSFSTIFSQSNNELEIVKKSYAEFNYNGVINRTDDLLKDKNRFSDEILIEIYNLKAASHFAMGDRENTRKSYIEILKINDDYKINAISFSPKLISFFENVKIEYHEVLTSNLNKKTSNDKTNNDLTSRSEIPPFTKNIVIIRSLLLPGWGHLTKGEMTKGWVLTSAGIVALGSMTYFIFDTNSKEQEYLSETNSALISSKYDEFNKSYKIRNALIISYAAIWLYSQVDILFNSTDLGSKNISVHKQIPGYNKKSEITLNLSLSF